MPELPEGIVTFVFTDVEGSTRLWEEAPESMMEALNQHDEVIDAAIAEHGGISVKPRGEGDSRFLVFTEAAGAVAAMAKIQAGLADVGWATPRPIRVRASIHTGAADLQLGDYYGSAVNRAARLRGIAHGGQTVMSGSTWELVRDRLPGGVSVRDMGEHGLKDLSRPEHVFQIDVPGVPGEFPALKSLDAVPNNLPEQLTDFVGRDAEVAEAKRLLEATRLLTILAPGGTGKTRLGIQTAADLVGDFPDGVFFVALADIGHGDEIIQVIAEALGVALSTDEDVRTQLLAYLSNKKQLLVLDNFEHLAEGATIIGEILRAASGVKVIATSRSKLNLSGEAVCPLGGLESTWESETDALQTGAVQLFLAAAKRANPSFVLSREDLEPLGDILAHTGGSPLGILLAAAWVDMLSIDEIAEEVRKSLDFLETEMGDVPDRHRSVRAVFDYSWALLSESEREMFAALSVFSGGFTRDAAQTVAGASLRNLATLSNKSLIAPSPSDGRYAIHELLRKYALDELRKDAERSREAFDAHADYYAELADPADNPTLRFNQAESLAILAADIENVRAGFRHSLSTGNAARALRFVVGVYFLYECRGWYQAGVSIFDRAYKSVAGGAEDPDSVTLRGMSAAIRGWFLALLGQAAVGLEAAGQGLNSLPESTNESLRSVARQCFAGSCAYAGSIEEMARITDEGIEEAAESGDSFLLAGMRNWRSFAALYAGDIETARALVPDAMRAFEELDEHYFMTWTLWLQAIIAMMDGNIDDAIDLYTRQVARAEEIDYLRGKVVAYEGLGDANLAAGLHAEAERAFVQAIVVAEQMGMVRDMLSIMTKVASVQAQTDRMEEAVALLATVRAEPASEGQPFTASVPIKESAGEVLTGLETSLPEPEFSAAHRRGTERPYDVAAKELMDRLAS